MTMKKLIVITLFIIGVSYSGKAQQTISPDHYLVHQYLINPAAAGMNGSNIFLDFRKQWTGFAGAPETQILCVDGTVSRDKIGLGLTVVNDQVNILGSTGALSTFAYRIKYGENHFLRIGLSAGINNNRILFDKIIAKDPSEVQLFQNNLNATSFDAAGGVLYEFGELKIGISASHLFEEKYYYENNFNSNNLNFQTIRHYIVNAQYRFNFDNAKWGMMPSARMLTAQGIKSLIGGGITGFYKKDFWLTLAYAHKVGYSVAIGGNISDNIIAGYSYSYSTNLVGYNQGTHDIILGLRFGSGNSGGFSDLKAIEELKNRNNELYETTDFLKNKNDELIKEVEQNKKDLEKMKEDIVEMKQSSGLSEEDRLMLMKLKSDFEVDEKELEKLANREEKDKDQIPNAKFGSYDYCVIVGAYNNVENAKVGQKILKKEFGLETTIIAKEDGKYMYLCSDFFQTPEEVKAEFERLKKLNIEKYIIGTPWIYHSK